MIESYEEVPYWYVFKILRIYGEILSPLNSMAKLSLISGAKIAKICKYVFNIY